MRLAPELERLLAENLDGKARRDGSATMRSAAAAARPLSGAARRKVYDALRRFPVDGGLTDEELVNVTGLNPSTVRPRRVELVERGLVEAIEGRTRPTRAGRAAQVWRAAPLEANDQEGVDA
jgi:predicted ArsR family transcriptional regulator